MKYNVSVIKGDGIGPEVIEVTLKVLKKLEDICSISFEFFEYEAGDKCLLEKGKVFPKETYDGIKKSDALLLGAIGENANKVILPIRQKFNLFTNIRPIKAYNNNNVNFIIFRENTEDLYKSKAIIYKNRVIDTRIITKKATIRIAKVACDYAVAHNLNKITIVDKSNVLTSCKFFRETACQVILNYPLQYETMYVDNAAMQMMINPNQFQIILTTNLFGDILSDLGGPLVGNLGLLPSANIGKNFGMFEPVHGSAPTIVGKGIANPIGAVLSGKMMLEYLGEKKGAKIVDYAVAKALRNNFVKTSEISDSLMEAMNSY